MRLRDTREAADYLGKVRGQPGSSAHRLKQLRTEGGGPRYRKVGRFVVYEEEELDRWADARLSPQRLSTTQTVEA